MNWRLAAVEVAIALGIGACIFAAAMGLRADPTSFGLGVLTVSSALVVLELIEVTRERWLTR